MTEPCEGCDPPEPQPARRVAHVGVWTEDEFFVDPDWSELPDDGLQLIKLIYADGYSRLMMGNDYYYRANGRDDFIYGQTDKEADLDPKRYDGLIVLRGRTTTDANLHRIIEEAGSWEG